MVASMTANGVLGRFNQPPQGAGPVPRNCGPSPRPGAMAHPVPGKGKGHEVACSTSRIFRETLAKEG